MNIEQQTQILLESLFIKKSNLCFWYTADNKITFQHDARKNVWYWYRQNDYTKDNHAKDDLTPYKTRSHALQVAQIMTQYDAVPPDFSSLKMGLPGRKFYSSIFPLVMNNGFVDDKNWRLNICYKSPTFGTTQVQSAELKKLDRLWRNYSLSLVHQKGCPLKFKSRRQSLNQFCRFGKEYNLDLNHYTNNTNLL